MLLRLRHDSSMYHLIKDETSMEGPNFKVYDDIETLSSEGSFKFLCDRILVVNATDRIPRPGLEYIKGSKMVKAASLFSYQRLHGSLRQNPVRS